MTRPCSQSHIQDYWVCMVLQSDPLKYGSCKFNIIINIINITLGLGIAATPKILGYNFAKRPNTFRFSLFFDIFYAKTIDPRHRAGHVISFFIKKTLIYCTLKLIALWIGTVYQQKLLPS